MPKNLPLARREFVKTLVAGTAGLGLRPAWATPAEEAPFSFLLLGDLHYDKLAHHDLAWLGKEKPDDLRQVRDYSRMSAEIMPRLMATARETVLDLNRTPETKVAFTAQVGDLVEGLCGEPKLALQQDTDALEFVRSAHLGVPFLFAKGNHDITGLGAPEAYKEIFQPFLSRELAPLNGGGALTSASYAFEHGGAQFCFLDAYDKENLSWLEAVLAKRTARHCFVIVHPPVVPYGARTNWILFAAERQRPQRERLLELLGKHHAFVLTGHIHKYNLTVRTVPAGRFLQLGLSSVIAAPEVQPVHVLSGTGQYNDEQLKVEPDFSPGTEPERRKLCEAEAPFVKQFEYADLPCYAIVRVNGPQVTAKVFAGVSRQLWRNLDLAQLMEA